MSETHCPHGRSFAELAERNETCPQCEKDILRSVCEHRDCDYVRDGESFVWTCWRCGASGEWSLYAKRVEEEKP